MKEDLISHPTLSASLRGEQDRRFESWPLEDSGSEVVERVLVEALRKSEGGLFAIRAGELPDLEWDGIVVTEEVRDLVRTRFSWTELGVFPIGEELPMLFRLGEWVGEGESVKRLEATAAFEEFLAKRAESVFLLWGEAGMGKSTFVEQAVAMVRQKKLREVLLTRCLAGSLPEDSFLRAGHFESAQDLADAVFESLPSERSLLVIEDVHWADAETLQLIEILAGRTDRRYEILLTSRRSSLPWAGARLVELKPLTQESLRELAGQALPGVEVTAEDVARLEEASGGHPLLALELLQAWHRAGRQAGRRGLLTQEIPKGSTLQKLTELITEDLPNESPQSVAALATLRGSFSRDLGEDLLGRLGLAWTGDFLVRTESGEWTFRHELFRSVFREKAKVDPAVLAMVLQKHTRPGEAAGHWEAAGEFEKAAEAHALAGSRALAEGRFVTAMEHAGRALDLEKQDGVTLNDGAAARWAQAMAAHFAGRHAKAYPLLGEALRGEGLLVGGAPAMELGKALLKVPLKVGGRVGRAEQVTRAYRILSEIDWLTNRLNPCIVNILRAQRASENLSPDDALRAETQAAGALALASLFPARVTRKRFAEALAACPEQERARVQLFYLLYRMGQRDWVEIDEEISRWRRQTRDRKLGYVFGFLEIAHASFRGDWNAALELTWALVRDTGNYGEENLSGLAQGTLACVLGQVDCPEAGLRILEETPQLREVAGHEYFALLATFLYQVGDQNEARQALREFEEVARQRPMVNYAFLMIFPGLCEAAIALEVPFALKFLGRQARHFPNHRPLSLAMKALAARDTGKMKRAIEAAQELGFEVDSLIAHGVRLGLDFRQRELPAGRARAVEHFWKK